MNTGRLFSVICMAAILVAVADSVQAQVGKELSQTKNLPPQLRETLKDIPIAGMACLNDSFVPAKPGASAIKRNAKRGGVGCSLTLDQLTAALGKPELLLIDTRSKAEFDASHIEGAVNFDASTVRTKRHLVDKFIVLLGDGKADQDLYEFCADLKDTGFKQVKVLRGGMLSWVLENRPRVGNASSLGDFASLTPGELFQESQIANNVLISLPGAHKLMDVLPTAIGAPVSSIEGLKAFIQKGKKTKGQHNIILIADEGFDMQRFPELAKATKPDPLLVYSGSEKAYREFLRVHKAMWTKQAKGPNKPSCGAL